MEQRTNIKFCFKLRKTAAETVETTEDEARPGCPFSVHNEGLIAKVRERIQEERCATMRMMADEFGVNRETIRQTLVEDLGKRKVSSWFVPHSLSDDQRHEFVQYAKKNH